MKQFWTPQRVYEFLKGAYHPNELLSRLLPNGAYCTENFLWAELLVAQTQMPSLLVLENLACVANRLQALRDTVFQNSVVIITSGWRSENYNKEIGGASQSKHLSGQAIDFCVMKFPPSKVQTFLKNFSGGLGAYRNFTHIDIGAKRRWTGE
jgi:hypothetical protein